MHKSTNVGLEQNKVNQVFDRIATKYDLMNDVVSFGLHRLWKKKLIKACGLKTGQQVLDLAGGSGDLSCQLSPLVGADGKVVLLDINPKMLKIAQVKIANLKLENVNCILANAEELPCADNSFDCVIIGFGLRNIPNKTRLLNSVYRVLKPNGKLLILDFSTPKNPFLNSIFKFYCYHVIPIIGRILANNASSYKYLANSIKTHPNQDQLAKILSDAKFARVEYENILNGIVALHSAIKPQTVA